MSDVDELQERKEQVTRFVNSKIIPSLKRIPKSVWIILVAVIVGLFGFFIRIANIARLKLTWAFPFVRLEKVNTLIDHTSGKYIPLALDPFVILRYVKEIVATGMLSAHDAMRYYPVGFNPQAEFTVLATTIAYLYHFLHAIFPSVTIELVHVIYPAIAFFVGLIFFFLTVKQLFGYKVGLVAALLLTIVPSFLYRTMSGFADKEALAMMLLFISFYFFIRAWKTKKAMHALLLGILAGVSTGINSLVWGGTAFVYMILGLFVVTSVMLEKFTKQDLFAYIGWFVATVYIAAFSTLSRTSFDGMAVSTTSGIMFFALALAFVYYFILKKDVLKIRAKVEKKLPLGLAAFLITFGLIIVVTSALFGLDFIPGKISNTVDSLIYPLGDRWSQTVAESHEPYISDWFGQMGAVFVILFLVAGIVLFFDAFRPLKKQRITATVVYGTLLLLFIFSRYSSGSPVLNGVSPMAKFLFVGPLVAFFVIAGIFYFYTYWKKREVFEDLLQFGKNYIFVLIWFIVMIMAARRAVRLIFVFSSIGAVLVAYVIVRVYNGSKYFKNYNYLNKSAFLSLAAMLLLLTVDRLLVFFSIRPGVYFESHLRGLLILALLIGFGSAAMIKELPEKAAHIFKTSIKILSVVFLALLVMQLSTSTIAQAKALGPSYHGQWQTAGGWVRANIPTDAVFAHWWDYGYWVQTGFERASVTDGGNAMGSWNHYMGRHLLTSPNDNETLTFLNTHEVTHILFVSDEIGKYPAFSSIGADPNYDRYSWINVYGLDQGQTRETRNATVYVYTGGTALDDDFVYQGKVFPAQAAGIAAFQVPIATVTAPDGQIGQQVQQPSAIIAFNGQPTQVPLNCLYIGDQKVLFGHPDGLDGCLRILPHLESQNPLGGAIYTSPDVTKSLFARLYLFNEQSPLYELVYSDDQSGNAPLAIYPGGRVFGPLRIWKLHYPPNTPTDPAYLSTGYIDPNVTKLA